MGDTTGVGVARRSPVTSRFVRRPRSICLNWSMWRRPSPSWDQSRGRSLPVDRDDFLDGGAAHFASVIRETQAMSRQQSKFWTPGFLAQEWAPLRRLAAAPDVFNHNLETVPSLYLTVRQAHASSTRSAYCSRSRNSTCKNVPLKSGIMVGLGEQRNGRRTAGDG